VTTLLDRGYQVRSLDRVPSPLPQHPQLEVLQGDIIDAGVCATAMDGIDRVFNTAAVIKLPGSGSVTDEYRRQLRGQCGEKAQPISHQGVESGHPSTAHHQPALLGVNVVHARCATRAPR
jgi:3beta-hydroxy-delta5-steroid dehydrogenase/steroid delta-isomerase